MGNVNEQGDDRSRGKRMAFARHLFECQDNGLAYARANGRDVVTASDRTGGSRWGKRSDVVAEVARLREESGRESARDVARGERAAVLSVKRKRELLCEMAEDVELKPEARVKAMAEDSRLAGHYVPEAAEVKVDVIASALDAVIGRGGV